MWFSVLAVSAGASGGALLRWWLGGWMNPWFAPMPIGTWVANLLGGYLVGVAVAVLAAMPHAAPEWRLLVVTGFLGGLTTFSTFSAEVVGLLQQDRWAWAVGVVAAHVLGSLLMTVAGMATVGFFRAG